MSSKVWRGKLHKIIAIMRGGPPRTAEFAARIIAGQSVRVQENTGRNELDEAVWRDIQLEQLHIESILRALAESAKAT